MSSRLALLCSRDPSPADLALLKLARMSGAPVTRFEVPDCGSPQALLAAMRADGCRVFAASGETFKALACARQMGPPSLDTLFAGFDYSFIYGLSQLKEADDAFVAWLTAGNLGGTEVLESRRTEYSTAEHAAWRQLSGLSFVDESASSCAVFSNRTHSPDFVPLLRAQQRPYLASARIAGCQVFFLASDRILHVDAPAKPGDPHPQLYPGLLPALLFLRQAFGEYGWNNPTPHAVLTIDDPPLKPRYGFFSFETLVGEMGRRGFASTVAFIPWNYRRHDPYTVELVKRHADRLSICIHGCDHTGGEFKAGDEAVLRAKARLASKRTGWLEEATGLQCDPVMIFPQGGFSKAALKVLKAEGYLAAVNTSVFANDIGPDELTIADVLDIAVTKYDGCPLFGRRYPRTVTDLALDLFLGKPAVIVEHHGFFRRGCHALGEFVDRLNSLEPRISWQPLAQAICASALYRRTGASTADVKCYTDQAIVSNPYGRIASFRVSRRIGYGAAAEGVLQDGAALDWRLNGETLEAAIELGPEARSVVTFRYSMPCAQPARRLGLAYGARAALRRYLCDFRDNYIARNPALLGASEKLARRFISQ